MAKQTKQTVSIRNYKSVFGKSPSGEGVWSFEICGRTVSTPSKMKYPAAREWALQFAAENHGETIVEIDVLRKDDELRGPVEVVSVANGEPTVKEAVASEPKAKREAAPVVTGDAKLMIAAVRAHAESIGKRGWEEVATWSDDQIAEVIGKVTNSKAAIAKVAKVALATWWEEQKAARAS